LISGTDRNKVNISTTTAAITVMNMVLFLIISLVVIAFYNNPFNIMTNILYQTTLAIPNLQANNNTNIFTSGSNDAATKC
jgi:hypothetical protein